VWFAVCFCVLILGLQAYQRRARAKRLRAQATASHPNPNNARGTHADARLHAGSCPVINLHKSYAYCCQCEDFSIFVIAFIIIVIYLDYLFPL
jgi:hypothetical protein